MITSFIKPLIRVLSIQFRLNLTALTIFEIVILIKFQDSQLKLLKSYNFVVHKPNHFVDQHWFKFLNDVMPQIFYQSSIQYKLISRTTIKLAKGDARNIKTANLI